MDIVLGMPCKRKGYVYPNTYIRIMERVIKLQRVGNSIRATIPKEVADELSLKEGEEVTVSAKEDALVIKKKGKNTVAQFYGILKSKSGDVKHWPSPEDIKSIWE